MLVLGCTFVFACVPAPFSSGVIVSFQISLSLSLSSDVSFVVRIRIRIRRRLRITSRIRSRVRPVSVLVRGHIIECVRNRLIIVIWSPD